MTDLSANRLLKLAARLDSVPREKFDLGVWKQTGPECGTTGCAMGYACSIPSFRAAGLKAVPRLVLDGDGVRSFSVMFTPQTDAARGRALENYRRGYGIGGNPSCYDNFAAAVAFFGLTNMEAYKLFSPDYYPNNRGTTPKQVAAKIREFVREKRKAAKAQAAA